MPLRKGRLGREEIAGIAVIAEIGKPKIHH